MSIPSQTSVGELVVRHPGWAQVFERLRIDYCCHGGDRLADVCRLAGLRVEDVERELEVADRDCDIFEEDWSAAPLRRLTVHITEIHHRYLYVELDRLESLMTRAAIYHGLRYHNLVDLAETFLTMKAELVDHMLEEEQMLFPMIRNLESGASIRNSLGHAIAAMEIEHRHVVEALEQIRRLSDDYAVPPDACPAYQTLITGLAELEEDLHQHIHKENNILFPRVRKMEQPRVEACAS